jgi:hypothetical protein
MKKLVLLLSAILMFGSVSATVPADQAQAVSQSCLVAVQGYAGSIGTGDVAALARFKSLCGTGALTICSSQISSIANAIQQGSSVVQPLARFADCVSGAGTNSQSGACVKAKFARQGVATIYGRFNVGEMLEAMEGTWSANPNFSYQWLANGTLFAKTPAVILTSKQLGKSISVKVFAHSQVQGKCYDGIAISKSSAKVGKALPVAIRAADFDIGTSLDGTKALLNYEFVLPDSVNLYVKNVRWSHTSTISGLERDFGATASGPNLTEGLASIVIPTSDYVTGDDVWLRNYTGTDAVVNWPTFTSPNRITGCAFIPWTLTVRFTPVLNGKVLPSISITRPFQCQKDYDFYRELSSSYSAPYIFRIKIRRNGNSLLETDSIDASGLLGIERTWYNCSTLNSREGDLTGCVPWADSQTHTLEYLLAKVVVTNNYGSATQWHWYSISSNSNID